MSNSTRTWLILPPLFCGLIPLLCIPFAHFVAIARHGTEFFLWLALLLVLPAMAAIPVFCAAMLGLAFRRIRPYAVALAASSGVYLMSFYAALRIGEGIRMHAFYRLAERSKPLVAAIRAYERQHGHAPQSLEALVPAFIPSLPSTGMGAYPEYQYHTSKTPHPGNLWSLSILAGSGGINFDQFIYLSSTNYPTTGYGGWLERIADWAYVHE